jgi:hypothetical protein
MFVVDKRRRERLVPFLNSLSVANLREIGYSFQNFSGIIHELENRNSPIFPYHSPLFNESLEQTLISDCSFV